MILSGRCKNAGLLLAVLLCGAWLALAAPAAAQVAGGVTLTLKDAAKSYDITPYVYVTRDPARALDYKTVYERHMAGARGGPVRGDMVAMGARGMPHWIVFEIENATKAERWTLSFGDHMDGRAGQMERIFVYDHLARATWLNADMKGRAIGTDVAVTIPPGGRSLFFIYAVPQAGVPATLPLHLAPTQAGAAAADNHNGRGVQLFLILLVGFFVGAAVIGRYPGGLFFAVYGGIQLALFVHQDGILLSPFPMGSAVAGALASSAVALALLAARSFLRVDFTQNLQSRILFGAVVLLGVLPAALAFVVPPASPVWAPLLFLPLPVSQVFLFMLAVAQAHNGRAGAHLFAAAWLVALAGSTLAALAQSGILDPTAPLVAAYWWALAPQGVFLASAVVVRQSADDRARHAAADEEVRTEKDVARLRQNKEISENQRLHRLIEHERQVMNELRDREIRQNEEMRKAKDAADEANRAKSAFLAVISHEIRTPMSGVMGMVRLLLETGLSKQQHEYAETIQDSGDAMLALLNDILDFEKIESGKMDIEHIDFDLHRLIAGVVTLMNGHAAAKKIALKSDLDPTVPRYVVGDPVRLRQVLLNLVGNAIKFTGEGGVTLRVQIDPSAPADQEARRARSIRFSVDDTGVGIPKDAQKNLFNPFAQADSSVARKFGGTGLGLAISQRLIEAMGGKIMIDSTEGEGSSFYFTLTMEEGSAESSVTATGAMPGAFKQKAEKALRVLVVEDNEINQKLMREFVTRMGHDVATAGTGEDALAQVRDDKAGFALVLMDVELPGISGMGATKAIRALPDRARASVPVIALTGNVRDEDIRACYAANMNLHLAKPVDPAKLAAAIDKVVTGKLDNPVVLADVADQGAGRVNRIDAPAPEKKKVPASESVPPLQAYTAAVTSDAAPVPDGVFDKTMLGGLRAAMKAGDFQDLMKSYWDKADELVGVLSAAGAASDMAALTARAHELKGMAANFGMTQVGILAGRAEKAGRDGLAAELPAILTELPAAHTRTKAALEKWLISD